MKNIYLLIISISTSILAIAQPATYSPKGIGGGGALFFPAVNPGNDNEFYVACDMSEMFHSIDFGRSYSQIHFTKLQVSSVSRYCFTNDTNIAYTTFNDGNNAYPVKTTDGGNNWKQIAGYNFSNYGQVYNMSSNYNKPNQLLINSYGDILFSGDRGNSFSLVKHTINNGAGLMMGGAFWDGNNIYVGTNEGLIYSTNSGTSFSVMSTTGIASGQLIISFAGAKNGDTTRFVCITANTADTYNGLNPWDYNNLAKGVYTMDNANGTWGSNSTGINFTNDFIMYAGMAWNDVNTIYLGGSDHALGANLVFKSTDGGSTWNKVFKTTNNTNIVTGWSGYNGDKNWSWGETCFGISVAPYNSNKVLFGDFGYIHTSADGGNNWEQAYVAVADEHPAGASTPKNKTYHSIGLENTTCWQVYWQDANNMMACFSDIGGIRSTDGGNTWGFTYNGFAVNSLYRITKGTNGNMYGACSNIHDMYESTRLKDAQLDASDGNGKIVYSKDNGANWLTLHSFGHPVYWVSTDPNNPNRMYASVIHYGGGGASQQGGIWMTNDLNNLATSTWTKLPNPPRTEGHPACIAVLKDGNMVCTFSGRINTSGAFTASSGVFIYNPTSNSWTDVSDAGLKYWTKDIVVDPKDASENTLYACVYSGWGGAPNGLGGLYKTTNRGTSWTKLTGSQFDRVSSITFNPLNLNQAYLTTETQGLWLSNDMNSNTPAWTLVMSYPFRQPERVYFNPYNQKEVWVTSFGNGMKVGNTGQTGIADFKNTENTFNVYPNPVEDFFNISGYYYKHSILIIDLYDNIGKLISNLLNEKSISGAFTRTFTLGKNVDKGYYIIKINTGNKVINKKLLKL